MLSFIFCAILASYYYYREEATFILHPPTKTRTLVRAAVNSFNNNTEIITLFQEKIAALIFKLHQILLPLYEILFGYKIYWWLAIKYIALALTLSPSRNILGEFHRVLLLWIKVNRNFQPV